jgi:hypothetical protein
LCQQLALALAKVVAVARAMVVGVVGVVMLVWFCPSPSHHMPSFFTKKYSIINGKHNELRSKQGGKKTYQKAMIHIVYHHFGCRTHCRCVLSSFFPKKSSKECC